jgi:hypothetical protein
MFEEDYIRLVIKPRVDMVLEDGVGSIKELADRFNEAHSCKVSKSRITEWLKALGYRVTRTVQIARPQPQRAPEPAPRVREEYETLHRQPPLPFNYPSPTSVFSNVQMPGFQE